MKFYLVTEHFDSMQSNMGEFEDQRVELRATTFDEALLEARREFQRMRPYSPAVGGKFPRKPRLVVDL